MNGFLGLNRAKTRAALVEENGLSGEMAEAVFKRVEPVQHDENGTAFYLEGMVDRAIEEIWLEKNRLSSPPNAFVSEKENPNMFALDGKEEPFTRIAEGIERLIEVLVPKKPDFIGTDYIASKIGKSKQWVGKMAEKGDIPKNCIAPKISGGRIWQFHRDEVNAWLKSLRKGAR